MTLLYSLDENSAFYSITPSPKVTARYNMFPTSEIVEHAVKAGFAIHSYQQKRVRDAERQHFCKHIVRLRKPGQLVVNDIVPEVVIVNSHDRSSSLQFMLGFFRCVCANGLITGDIFSDLGRILHSHKNPMEAVLDRIDNVYKISEQKIPVIQGMRDVRLNNEQMNDFVQQAVTFTPSRTYDTPMELAFINRYEDKEPTLWNVFNRVQENMLKGEARIVGINGRSRKARAINGLDTSIDVNRKLWNLAESYLPLAA
jgi:hypothetical protein